MISKQVTQKCLGMLSALRYFPSNPHAVAELGRRLNKYCQNDQEAERLVRDILDSSDEWMGPSCLRPVRVKCFDLTSITGVKGGG